MFTLDTRICTVRYELFVYALEDLCLAHGVQLSTDGSDTIVVNHLELGDEPIYEGRIQNGN